MEKSIVDVLIVGGPVAAMGILSIWINYKLTTMWIQKNTLVLQEIAKSLGEMGALLRKQNGKGSS